MKIKEIINKFKIPIKEILIDFGLVNNALSLIDNIGFRDKNILVVSDQTTYLALGKKIIISFKEKHCKSFILLNPKADQENVTKIINKSVNIDLIVAVGSGTINDLCKFASFIKKIPYIVFGTASSMNGYASANASITVNSHKTSLPAHLPTAIYLDLDILSKAPKRLMRSGIGDSLCFSTCHFDWLLSHFILGSYYNNIPFDLLKNHYKKLINYQKNISDDNIEFIRLLTKILIISGLGMYIAGGSYPASQAEHLIAHYIEIKYPQMAINSYHGEQIAITTLEVAKIQENILARNNITIKPNKINENDLKKIFDTKLAKYFYNEIKNKFIDENLSVQINIKLKDWNHIKQQLQEFHIKKDDLLKIYQKFSLPENINYIQISDDIYKKAVDNAYLIRNRFTSLDFIKFKKKEN